MAIEANSINLPVVKAAPPAAQKPEVKAAPTETIETKATEKVQPNFGDKQRITPEIVQTDAEVKEATQAWSGLGAKAT